MMLPLLSFIKPTVSWYPAGSVGLKSGSVSKRPRLLIRSPVVYWLSKPFVGQLLIKYESVGVGPLVGSKVKPYCCQLQSAPGGEYPFNWILKPYSATMASVISMMTERSVTGLQSLALPGLRLAR